MSMTALPDGAAVLTYMGQTADLTDPDWRPPLEHPDATPPPTEQCALATTVATTMATMTRSYCRGIGFSADGTQAAEDIAAVIVTATARELNTSPGLLREEIGNYRVFYDGTASGFTLRELAVLNSYRRMAT